MQYLERMGDLWAAELAVIDVLPIEQDLLAETARKAWGADAALCWLERRTDTAICYRVVNAAEVPADIAAKWRERGWIAISTPPPPKRYLGRFV